MGDYSTNSIEWVKYGPHGRVEISESLENIIIYKAVGPFNKELIKALDELEQPFLKERIQRDEKWVTLIEFKESCMITIEAKEIFSRYLEQCRESGIIQLATAMVITNDVEGKNMAESIYGQFYRNIDVPCQIFEVYDSAVNWLIEQYQNRRS